MYSQVSFERAAVHELVGEVQDGRVHAVLRVQQHDGTAVSMAEVVVESLKQGLTKLHLLGFL